MTENGEALGSESLVREGHQNDEVEFSEKLVEAERTALIKCVVELCAENRMIKEHRDILVQKLQHKEEIVEKERREVLKDFVQQQITAQDKNKQIGEYALSLEKLLQAERNAFSKAIAELLIENHKMKTRLDREILLNHENYFQRPHQLSRKQQ